MENTPSPSGLSPLEKTLSQRGNDYGSYKSLSQTVQSLKFVMRSSENWQKLSSEQKESLEMIATKIGRVLTGNPDLEDNWHDIAGYAQLINRR